MIDGLSERRYCTEVYFLVLKFCKQLENYKLTTTNINKQYNILVVASSFKINKK